jgi:AcrR family transcriptional regulator
MTKRMTQRGRKRPAAPAGRQEHDQSTRQKLLEAAGQVFAEQGFDRATGKEICERAGTNTAAVNYYFSGVAGLYTAVLREAQSRLVTAEALSAAVAGKADARAKLEAIIRLFVGILTGPTSSSWALRVAIREVVDPSPAGAALAEKEMRLKVRILRAVVGELMGLPADHPAVARGCVSVMAPCVLLLIYDRHTLMRAFPDLSLAPEDAEALVRYLLRYALAGLSAVAADARREE